MVTAERTVPAGGQLIEAWAEDATTLNPVLVGDTFSELAAGLCFEPLVSRGPDGEPLPALAAALPSVDADGVTWTVRLRPGLRWSDGAPLTAQDVVFTYNLMYAPSYAALPSPWRPELSARLGSVTAFDPHTVVFRTTAPYASFLTTHGRYGVLPSHVLGGLSAGELAESSFNCAPDVVSGMFQLSRWDRGKQLVFTRNDHHHRGRPRLASFVYRVMRDGTEVADALRDGEVDAGIVDPSRLAELSTVDHLRIVSFDMPSCTFYAYQLDPVKPAGRIFSDPAVRQALLLAIDRTRLVDDVYRGLATVADSVLPPMSWAHDPQVEPRYPFDPARAADLLAAAGWRRDGGVRTKDGQRLAVRLTTGSNALVWQRAADLITGCWRRIGVEAEVRVLEFAELVEEVVQRREFDVFLLAYDWGNDPDQSVLFSSAAAQPGGLNCFGFRDAEVDELLATAAASHDRGRRLALYRAYQRAMARLVPAPALCFNRGVYAVNRRVHEYHIGPWTQFGARQWLMDTWVGSDG